MGQVFNADEVFAIGVEIEKNGKAFYLAAKDRTDDPVLKKLFDELAKWENNHINFFEKLRNELPTENMTQLEYDPDNIVHLYLKSVADEKIFLDQDYAIDSCRDSLDILKKALEFEKDAVVLYSSMKDIVPEEMGKKEIDKLVYEELKHVAQLTKEIGKLKRQSLS